METPEYQKQVWFVVTNDLVGGEAISVHDKPLSEHDVTGREIWIADGFIYGDAAAYICKLHNTEVWRRLNGDRV